MIYNVDSASIGILMVSGSIIPSNPSIVMFYGTSSWASNSISSSYALTASNLYIGPTSAPTNYYLLFATGSTNTVQPLYDTSNLAYNPGQSILTVGSGGNGAISASTLVGTANYALTATTASYALNGGSSVSASYLSGSNAILNVISCSNVPFYLVDATTNGTVKIGLGYQNINEDLLLAGAAFINTNYSQTFLDFAWLVNTGSSTVPAYAASSVRFECRGGYEKTGAPELQFGSTTTFVGGFGYQPCMFLGGSYNTSTTGLSVGQGMSPTTPPTNGLYVAGNINCAGSITAPQYYGTSSWALNIISSSYALTSSYTLTSSYSINGKNSLSSSWASSSISSSYCITSSYSINGGSSISSSWASSSISSSYTLSSSWAPFQISASWASSSISSSYSITSSYALSGGSLLTTGSTYPITSSWANTASYFTTYSGSSQLYLQSTDGYTYPVTLTTDGGTVVLTVGQTPVTGSNGFINIGTIATQGITTISSSYTASISDYAIICTNTSPISIYLTNSLQTGQHYNIKNYTTLSAAITVIPSTGTIDGQSTMIVAGAYSNMEIINVGSGNWAIL